MVVNTQKKQRAKCERYSRIVGYLRPVEQWNEGKKAEWDHRLVFETCVECKDDHKRA